MLSSKLKSVQQQSPELPWASVETQKPSLLWYDSSIQPKQPSILLENWQQMEELLKAAQQEDLKLYTSQGPTPHSENEGLQVQFSSSQGQEPIQIERSSMLLIADSRYYLDDIESYAKIQGLTTGFRMGTEQTLLSWIETANPLCTDVGQGQPFHNVFSLEAILPSGNTLSLGRGPRAATGPDMRSLFWGTGSTFGIVTKVCLKLRKDHSRQPFRYIKVEDSSNLSSRLSKLFIHQQIPEELHLSFHMESEASELYIRISQEKESLFQQRLFSGNHPQERKSRPLTLPQKHVHWLVCQTTWSELDQVVEKLRKNPEEKPYRLHLTNAYHEAVTLLLEYQSIPTPRSHKKRNHTILALLGSSTRLWNEPFFLAPSQKDIENTKIYRRLKQELDPNNLLNPHILSQSEVV